MRHLPTYKAMQYVAPSLIVSCLFVSPLTMGTPSQVISAASTTPVSANQQYKKTANANVSPVFVRNTPAKSEPSTAPVTAKKTHDKKAISRCWQRLMHMIREVNHVQRTKKD